MTIAPSPYDTRRCGSCYYAAEARFEADKRLGNKTNLQCHRYLLATDVFANHSCGEWQGLTTIKAIPEATK